MLALAPSGRLLVVRTWYELSRQYYPASHRLWPKLRVRLTVERGGGCSANHTLGTSMHVEAAVYRSFSLLPAPQGSRAV